MNFFTEVYDHYTRYLRYSTAIFSTAIFLAALTFTLVNAADGNITATAGLGGTISPSGITFVTEGNDQTFTITPDIGYHIADVLVDSISEGAISSYTFFGVTTDHTIEATFAIDQFTITSTAGVNGSISTTATVDYGSDATFLITPDSGYVVDTLTIDGNPVATTTSYTFTNVQADATIEATFILIPAPSITYEIIASAGPNGSISPSGTTTVTENADQTFTITPDTGYTIDSVIVDGISLATLSTYTFTSVVAPHTITVTFALIVTPPPSSVTYPISATSGPNGTISPSGTTIVAENANQTYTITPDAGYTIGSVLVDNVSFATLSTYTFLSVTATHTIAVTFDALPTYAITATVIGNGSISPLGTTNITEGFSQTYTIIPSLGYILSTLTIDGNPVATTTSYTFTNVQADATIEAAFVSDPSYSAVQSRSGSSKNREAEKIAEAIRLEAEKVEQEKIAALEAIISELERTVRILAAEQKAKELANEVQIIKLSESVEDFATLTSQVPVAEKNTPSYIETETETTSNETTHTSTTGEVIQYQAIQVKEFFTTRVVNVVSKVVNFFSLF